MIEIALYNHKDENANKQNYPLYDIQQFSGTAFADFQKEARYFIQSHSNDKTVIINKYPANFNFNLFAVALVIESLRMDNNINCVAIKVDDLTAATNAFKPFIALTFGLKYVHTLQEMNADACFRDISALGYLDLNIRQKYSEHKLILTLSGLHKLPKITTHSFSETMEAVAFIKTLALMKDDYSLEVELSGFEKEASFNEDAVFEKVVNRFVSLS